MAVQVAALLAAVLVALSVLVLFGRHDDRRLAEALPRVRRPPARPGRLPPAIGACLLAGIGAAVLVASPVGIVLGAALALGGPHLLGRLEPREQREQREQLAADLPLLLELLSACLAGGAALPSAAEAVRGAIPGPAGSRLADVCAALAVGTPPGEAWGRLAGGSATAGQDEDPLAAAARVLGRAAEGGAPVAAAVTRLASEARAEARARGEQAARRVGVLAVAPLGLCFLPAFVLLGVVPVVAGLAGPLLASF